MLPATGGEATVAGSVPAPREGQQGMGIVMDQAPSQYRSQCTNGAATNTHAQTQRAAAVRSVRRRIGQPQYRPATQPSAKINPIAAQ